MKAISIKDVSFQYSKEQLLKKVNLEIEEGAFLGLVGPNGGGKTTLIKLILGLIKPEEGEIKLFGKNPEKGREKVGYLSQREKVDFSFPITVKEIVMLSRVNKKLLKKFSEEDEEIAHKAIKKMDLLELQNRKLDELSGGEKQRVFIARALATEPKMLILDEPTSNVDINIQNDLYKWLKEINKEMTILIVDHNVEMVSKYATEIACVNKCIIHGMDYHKVKKGDRC